LALLFSEKLSDALGSGARPDQYLIDKIIEAANGMPMSVMPWTPGIACIKGDAKLVDNLVIVPESEDEMESLAVNTGD
jgi:hypothetical protein